MINDLDRSADPSVTVLRPVIAKDTMFANRIEVALCLQSLPQRQATETTARQLATSHPHTGKTVTTAVIEGTTPKWRVATTKAKLAASVTATVVAKKTAKAPAPLNLPLKSVLRLKTNVAPRK